MHCYFMQPTKPDSEGNVRYHPCGRCIACRKKNATAFAIRCYFESLYYDSSLFVSLSYDDEHLPVSSNPKYSGNLDKVSAKKFIKSLDYYSGSHHRYLIAGEYGDSTKRPHYHCLIFGLSISDKSFFDRLWLPRKKGWLCRSKAWSNGDVFVKPLDALSCFYTLKYSVKNTKKDIKELEALGMQPPFRIMSLKPGLGYQYLVDNMDKIKTDGFIRFKGSKIHVPRYYYDKIWPVNSKERELHSLFVSQQNSSINKDFYKTYKDLVGVHKKYGSWSALLSDFGEQQEFNFKHNERN